MWFRIKNSKLKQTATIEGIFIKNEIAKNENLLCKLRLEYREHYDYVYENLNFTEFVDLMKFISKQNNKLISNRKQKNHQSLNFLKSRKFGTIEKQHITNLSSYKLSDNEEFALSFGLNFSLPIVKVDRERVLSSFEMYYTKVNKHVPVNKAERTAFKSNLGYLAHGYTKAQSDKSLVVPVKEIGKSVALLKKNESIVITKPDKGSGTVILDRAEYLKKMLEIVDDRSKFEYIGPVERYDKTHRIELKLREFLTQLEEAEELPKSVTDSLKPTGSQRPRLYGLPKTHKEGTPLRPILSMLSSPQHKLAKFLNELLQPVTTKFSKYTVKDSFEFVSKIRSVVGENTYMASFDVKSLFTNVPLVETIDICADALYDYEETNFKLKRINFVELMRRATCGTEFSLNGNMYRQTDGVAMGSPLGPILANIFMGFLEERYFGDTNDTNIKPLMYHRYVDDCFVLFKNKDDCARMFKDFNELHPSISFTMEPEENNRLPFLDVLVHRVDEQFVTSVYRKRTFTGQYVNFQSHCSRKRKINLIKTLCHRAVFICSPSTLDEELNTVIKLLTNNGYPEQLVRKTIKYHREKLSRPTVAGPDKCTEYIKLPFLGIQSTRLEKELKAITRNCYYAIEPRVIFESKPILSHVHKDRIPITNTSMVIYHYKCCCDNNYIGQTRRRLGERITEHIPRCVLEHYEETPNVDYTKSKKLRNAARKSSIAEHLLTNKSCGVRVTDRESHFSILKKCNTLFELRVLESVMIATMNPTLCKQQEFDFVTSLV